MQKAAFRMALVPKKSGDNKYKARMNFWDKTYYDYQDKAVFNKATREPVKEVVRAAKGISHTEYPEKVSEQTETTTANEKIIGNESSNKPVVAE